MGESSEKVMPDGQYLMARAVRIMKSGMTRAGADVCSIPSPPPLDKVTCEMYKLCSAMCSRFIM